MKHMEKKKLDQASGKISKLSLVLEIRRIIYLFAKSRYICLKEMPINLLLIVMFLERYSELINCKVFRRFILPVELINATLMG